MVAGEKKSVAVRMNEWGFSWEQFSQIRTHLAQLEHPRVFGAQVELLLVHIRHGRPAVVIAVASAPGSMQVKDTYVQQTSGEDSGAGTQRETEITAAHRRTRQHHANEQDSTTQTRRTRQQDSRGSTQTRCNGACQVKARNG